MTGFAYAFGGTCIILFIMNLIPGLSLRASEQAEVMGIDDAELGEFAVSLLHKKNIEQGSNFGFSMITWKSHAKSYPRITSMVFPNSPTNLRVSQLQAHPPQKHRCNFLYTVEYFFCKIGVFFFSFFIFFFSFPQRCWCLANCIGHTDCFINIIIDIPGAFKTATLYLLSSS